MKIILLFFFMSLFSTFAIEDELECLDSGWPASFEGDVCKKDQHINNQKCTDLSVACSPALFGIGVCIEESSSEVEVLTSEKKKISNSNLKCILEAKKSDINEIANYISTNEEEYKIFDRIYQERYIICDEDFGDIRNNVYCAEMIDWLDSILDEMEKSENNGPDSTEDPLGEMIHLEDNLETFLHENPTKGPSFRRRFALPINENGEGLARLSTNGASENLFSSSELTFSFPSEDIVLNSYNLNPTQLVPDEPKQYYLEFKEVKPLSKKSALKVKSYALATTLIEKLRSSFDPEHKQSIVNLLNSLKPEDWKKFLFGEQSKKKDIFRYSGVLELKRKYQDLDEHLKIMMNEKYSSQNFEEEYFIPTGFIEIDDNEFLSIQEIIDGNIKIDPDTLKINLLKDVTVFVFNEMAQNENISKDFKESVKESICKNDCDIPENIPFGDVIKVISEMKVSEADNANEAIYCLLSEFFKLCPSESFSQILENIKKKIHNVPKCDQSNF